jgi:hypothetical protein
VIPAIRQTQTYASHCMITRISYVYIISYIIHKDTLRYFKLHFFLLELILIFPLISSWTSCIYAYPVHTTTSTWFNFLLFLNQLHFLMHTLSEYNHKPTYNFYLLEIKINDMWCITKRTSEKIAHLEKTKYQGLHRSWVPDALNN